MDLRYQQQHGSNATAMHNSRSELMSSQQQLDWSVDTTVSRKTSLLEDEREPHELLMLDSDDVTQQSMDSLDGFNSEAELIKLERCRTMPVSALYDAMRRDEENGRDKLASGRSLSMSSLGSLWDREYRQRATEYTTDFDERDKDSTADDENHDFEDHLQDQDEAGDTRRFQNTPVQHSFRLHTPIPEEDGACSSGSNESITYVFMNPQAGSACSQASSGLHNLNSPIGHSPGTNPSSILHYHHKQQQELEQLPNTVRRVNSGTCEENNAVSKMTFTATSRTFPRVAGQPNEPQQQQQQQQLQQQQQQPRTLSMDSIDVEHCMNLINRPEMIASKCYQPQQQQQEQQELELQPRDRRLFKHRHHQTPLQRSAISRQQSQQQQLQQQSDEPCYRVDTPQTTLERKRAAEGGRRLRREHSGVHIESTDQEYPGVEPTPYNVESATTDDPETTGLDYVPRLWSRLHHCPRRESRHDNNNSSINNTTSNNNSYRHHLDSGSDYDGNDHPGIRVASLQRPPSHAGRRASTKARRKPSRTRAIETQTEDDLTGYSTGYSSQPSSPGITRKTFTNDSYALMRSITSGSPLNEAAQQLGRGKLEPTVHLLTEVVSLMKLMMTNIPPPRCHSCQQCSCCSSSALNEPPLPLENPPGRRLQRPNFLNLSTLSDSAASDPEPSPAALPSSSSGGVAASPPGAVAATSFREGFLIERFRLSRQDRMASARSQSDLASDAEPDPEADDAVDGDSDHFETEALDSLAARAEARGPTSFGRLSGASTPTDEFRTLPSLAHLAQRSAVETADKLTNGRVIISTTDTTDSGISDRWESPASSCGSAGSRRGNQAGTSSDSVSGGPSSISSAENSPDSSLGHVADATVRPVASGGVNGRPSNPVLTQWTQLVDVPARTSTPVRHLTTWAEQARKPDRTAPPLPSRMGREFERQECSRDLTHQLQPQPNPDGGVFSTTITSQLTQAYLANTSTETSASFKTTKSHLSRYEEEEEEEEDGEKGGEEEEEKQQKAEGSPNDFSERATPKESPRSTTDPTTKRVIRPSKLAMLKEREPQQRMANERGLHDYGHRCKNDEEEGGTSPRHSHQPEVQRASGISPGKSTKPIDELKKKWQQTPCDLIPNDSFLPLSTQTRLRCSPVFFSGR